MNAPLRRTNAFVDRPPGRGRGDHAAGLIFAGLLAVGCAASPGLPAGYTNSLGMQFNRIPAGEFLMGSDETAGRLAVAFPTIERERFELADEAPVHRVRITRPFYMGRHEVTVGQFRRFVDASGYRPESIADGTGGYGYDPNHDRSTSPVRESFAGRDPRYSWQHTGFAQGDDHPVVNISWNDAQAMARWLSGIEGRRYRLPTEAEWEYACRAGTGTRYHGGDDPAGLLRIGNLFDQDSARQWPQWTADALPGRDGYPFTAPVGRFAANAWGLHDMHGNAWEWIGDWYGSDYYGRSPNQDPTGPDHGDVRVRRGGSWHTWPFYARSSFRNWSAPDTRYVLVGMRLVMEAEPGPAVARPTATGTPLAPSGTARSPRVELDRRGVMR